MGGLIGPRRSLCGKTTRGVYVCECLCVCVQCYFAWTSIKVYMTTNLAITVIPVFEPAYTWLVHFCTKAHKKHASEQISAYSASAVPCERTRVSHSRDDQWGGEEQSSQQAAPAVCILPLALVHLSTAVVTAAAHAEEEPDDGHQNGKQQANRRTYQEADLVVDDLGRWWMSGKENRVKIKTEKCVGGKNGKRRDTWQEARMKGEKQMGQRKERM